MFLTNSKALFRSLSTCSFSTKMGTKAELNAPSAKILRKKFGNLKAAKNTSDKMLTPRNLAIRTSRMNPRIRESEIKKEMTKTDLNMVIF